MCRYINKKKDNNDAINRPLTEIDINFNSFFFEKKNWKVANIRDSQSAIFPKEGAIYQL